MVSSVKQLLTSQSLAIYTTLQKNGPLTAREIGSNLKIFPNAVYRSIKRLVEMGMVRERQTYPISYEAVPSSEALEFYSNKTRHDFLQIFPTQSEQQLDISFLQKRDELIVQTNGDIQKAKQSVRFIVSGLEVPADTILVYKQAIDRGIEVQALVQNKDETNELMFANWKKMGIEVRYYPFMEARIFIIDETIVYFTSYNPGEKEEALGMRFNYKPYARVMNEVFLSRWKNAQEL